MWLFYLILLKLFYTSWTKSPNIIVIIADDMGFNDVGFRGSNEIPTPNIDALAYNGVILNQHYTQALCTPSRSAFLTGKYPIHLGMQHLVILEPEPWGLPLNVTLLPEFLKINGYKTHAVGKWHLGFFKKEYTPTYRGFDTHFGYWQGLQDYYKHTVHATFSHEYGYDMRRNMDVEWSAQGKYSTTLFTEEAVKLIEQHDTDQPMFMYLAHLAPHTGNDNDPLQAPDEIIAKFANIKDPERRIYAAMVSMLDDSVGKIIKTLRRKQMLDNSIILFMSDNGAQTEGIHANHGSNYPLRGMKNSAWEGAVRGVAAIWSPLIKQPQRISNNLMHISDWLPTFYSAAGLNKSELPSNIDGLDQWSSISENSESPRTEMLYNIDDVYNYGAVRLGDWKYLYGSTSKGKKDSWYGSSGKNPEYFYNETSVLTSATANSLAGVITYRQIKEKNNNFSIELLSTEKIELIRNNVEVKCVLNNSKDCNPLESPCLFNLKDDPCERVNLAKERPNIVLNMEHTLARYRKSALPPRNVPRDPNADPVKWNNTWTNWQDYVQQTSNNHIILSPLSLCLISLICFGFLILVVTLISITLKKHDRKPLDVIIEEKYDEQTPSRKSTGLQFELNVFKDDFRTVK